MRWFLIILGSCVLATNALGQAHTRLKRDEQIVFYPSLGVLKPDGSCEIEIRGCVYERESRWLALAALRKALGLADIEMSPAERRVFADRARLFLVDHEHGKQIVARVGGTNLPVASTDADGWFGSIVRISAPAPVHAARDGIEIEIEAVLPPADQRVFKGSCLLLRQDGLSVVSDIDDTIKITEVLDRKAMLRNTFLRTFKPVPGMAALYQELARSNHAVFHYVSASPWQLYQPLAEFVVSNGFPAGSFHLKKFRWRAESFRSLLAGPEKFKLSVLESLIERCPRRRFLLIGDSGERDPEVYAVLARKYPQQVVGVWIRDVTGESREAERYRKAFTGLPESLWQVFRDPAEIRKTPF
ncbi:MAG: DUF2183 domain-containing protein [Verrucomicrobiae bacterium]|nr:DUF2183 domain-containing protein [Verrucomicrobiae bacterium]